MKSLLKLAAAAAVITAASGTAHAAESYWRLDLGVGVDTQADIKITATDGFTTATESLSGDVESDVAIGGGYGFAFGQTRIEGAVAYESLDGGDDDGAEITFVIGTINAYYDLQPISGFRPFVGGGVGVGRSDVDIESDFGALKGEDTGLTWHVGFGGTFGEKGGLELAYRYVSLPDAKAEASFPVLGFAVKTTVEGEFDSHQLRLGYRF